MSLCYAEAVHEVHYLNMTLVNLASTTYMIYQTLEFINKAVCMP